MDSSKRACINTGDGRACRLPAVAEVVLVIDVQRKDSFFVLLYTLGQLETDDNGKFLMDGEPIV